MTVSPAPPPGCWHDLGQGLRLSEPRSPCLRTDAVTAATPGLAGKITQARAHDTLREGPGVKEVLAKRCVSITSDERVT